MKVWALISAARVLEDTSYLLGRVASQFSALFVDRVADSAETPPAPPIERIDAIFNRSLNARPVFFTNLDRLANDLGVPAINPGAASLRACDKRTYLGDFPAMIPGTWVVHSLEEILRLQRDLADEVVLKDPYGGFGKDVIRFRGEEDSADALALLAKVPDVGVVAQIFCRGFLEGDKRIIAQRAERGGFEVVAWFKRVPAPGGWKSNVSAGGRIVMCDLEEEERTLALEVAEIAGLDYVGIDVSRENGRSLLIEINAYTGGHVNFDIEHRAHSGGDLARMIRRLAEQGRR